MSIANILNEPRNSCPSQYNLKCNSLEVCSDINTNNVNTVTINNNSLAPLLGGLNNQFLKTVATTPTWVNFSLNDLPGGPSFSVLHTDGLNNVVWSTFPILQDLTVLNSFNSVNDNTLDNVNIVQTLKINNISATPLQMLSTDSFGVLGWNNISIPSQKKAIYFCTANQNINFAVNTSLTFTPPTYNNLLTEVTHPTLSNFIINEASAYMIECNISVIPSLSQNEIGIYVNGIGQSFSFIDITSTFCKCQCIVNLVINDLVQVISTRVNLDASAKNNLNNNFASSIIFTKL